MIGDHHQQVALLESLDHLADQYVVVEVDVLHRVLELARVLAARGRVPAVAVPVELSRVDDEPADDDAVAGQELGRGEVDEVGAERVRDIAAAAGYTDATTTVSFCNTGHWAAINWFALSELADYNDVRLYAESMAEYTALDLPRDNAPNRLQYAYRASASWLASFF